MTLTPEQLQILQHALGVNKYGRYDERPGCDRRNHFCAGGDDEVICRELVAMGLMRTFERSYLSYYNCLVTDEGKKVMRKQSPKPPKLSRGQKRYRQFLRCNLGISFREWLKCWRAE